MMSGVTAEDARAMAERLIKWRSRWSKEKMNAQRCEALYLRDRRTGSPPCALNRPDRKNPLTFDSYAELRDWFRDLIYADDVDVVIFALERRAISARAGMCMTSSGR